MIDFDSDDLKPVEIPFKKNGKNYILREASADAASRYRNHMFKHSRLDANGQPVVSDGLADGELLLVSYCAFEQRVGKTGSITEVAVPIAEVRSWPNRMQSYLYEKLREISALVERDTKEKILERIKIDQAKLKALEEVGEESSPKNLPSATSDSSD